MTELKLVSSTIYPTFLDDESWNLLGEIPYWYYSGPGPEGRVCNNLQNWQDGAWSYRNPNYVAEDRFNLYIKRCEFVSDYTQLVKSTSLRLDWAYSAWVASHSSASNFTLTIPDLFIPNH